MPNTDRIPGALSPDGLAEEPPSQFHARQHGREKTIKIRRLSSPRKPGSESQPPECRRMGWTTRWILDSATLLPVAACGSVADLLHRMAFEMKSACSQTQNPTGRKNPRPGSLFLLDSSSHMKSHDPTLRRCMSQSPPTKAGDRYREGSARWAPMPSPDRQTAYVLHTNYVVHTIV